MDAQGKGKGDLAAHKQRRMCSSWFLVYACQFGVIFLTHFFFKFKESNLSRENQLLKSCLISKVDTFSNIFSDKINQVESVSR